MKKFRLKSLDAMLKRSYNQGFKDGRKRERQVGQSYEDGLNDAWECARQVVCPPYMGGIGSRNCLEIFKTSSSEVILEEYSPAEAIQAIASYSIDADKRCGNCEIYMRDECKGQLAEYRTCHKYKHAEPQTNHSDSHDTKVSTIGEAKQYKEEQCNHEWIQSGSFLRESRQIDSVTYPLQFCEKCGIVRVALEEGE